MEHLHPACFALVIATGIVSVACHILGLTAVAAVPMIVNVVNFAFPGFVRSLFRIVRSSAHVSS